MENFGRNIAAKYGLDMDAVREFVGYLERVEVDKSERIVAEGDFNDNFYILKDGLLRAYVPTEDGEQTLWFGYPGQAVFDVWCYHYGKLSRIAIEAVVPSVLYAIPKAGLEKLCVRSLSVCNLVRKIFVGHAAETEESSTNLFECDGGLERYLSVLRRHPELLQCVPLNKLASYMRLAPQSLSRIRARLK